MRVISDGGIVDGCEEVDCAYEREVEMLFRDNESASLLSLPAT